MSKGWKTIEQILESFELHRKFIELKLKMMEDELDEDIDTSIKNEEKIIPEDEPDDNGDGNGGKDDEKPQEVIIIDEEDNTDSYIEFTFERTEPITSTEQAERWKNLSAKEIVEELGLDWVNVQTQFQEVNPQLKGNRLFDWIKRSIIEFGWREEPALDYNEIIVTEHEDGNLIIEAPTFDKSWSYAKQDLALPEYSFYYYKPKHSSAKLKRHQLIFGSKAVVFNKRLHKDRNYQQMLDELLLASGDYNLYQKALKEGKIGEAFVDLVKSAQEVLFFNKDDSFIDGMLGNDTLDALEAYKEEIKFYDPYLESMIRRYAKEKKIMSLKILKAGAEFENINPTVFSTGMASETTQQSAMHGVRNEQMLNDISADSKSFAEYDQEARDQNNARLTEFKKYLDKRLDITTDDDALINQLLAQYPRPPQKKEYEVGDIYDPWNEKLTGQDWDPDHNPTLWARYGDSKDDLDRVKTGYQSWQYERFQSKRNAILTGQPQTIELEEEERRHQLSQRVIHMGKEMGFFTKPESLETSTPFFLGYKESQYLYFSAWLKVYLLLSAVTEKTKENNLEVPEDLIQAIQELEKMVFPGKGGYQELRKLPGSPTNLWNDSKKSYKETIAYYDYLLDFVLRRAEQSYYEHDIIKIDEQGNRIPMDENKFSEMLENNRTANFNYQVSHIISTARKNGSEIYKVPASFESADQPSYVARNPADGDPFVSDQPITMYYEITKDGEHVLHMILGPKDTQVFRIENDSLYKCILEMAASGDVLPDGTLRYIDPFTRQKMTHEIEGSGVKMSDILTGAAIVLGVAAIIFSGGAAAPFFIMAAAAAGIARSGYVMYEKNSIGQLTEQDIALESAYIVAELLPFVSSLSKAAKLTSSTNKFLSKTGKFVEGGTYYTLSTTIDISIGGVDGIILFDSVLDELNMIDSMQGLDDTEKAKKKQEVLKRALLLGLLILGGTAMQARGSGKSGLKSSHSKWAGGKKNMGVSQQKGSGSKTTVGDASSGTGGTTTSTPKNTKTTTEKIRYQNGKYYRKNPKTNAWEEVTNQTEIANIEKRIATENPGSKTVKDKKVTVDEEVSSQKKIGSKDEFEAKKKKSNDGEGVNTKSQKTGVTASTHHKVGYGSSDLSKKAIEWRQQNDYWGPSNIAVCEYVDEFGKIQYITAKSTPRSKHSERIIIEMLEEKGIPLENVKRVYSELQPCELPGAYCSSLLQNKVPQAKISYSFDYSGSTKDTRHIRQKGIDDRAKEFEKYK